MGHYRKFEELKGNEIENRDKPTVDKNGVLITTRNWTKEELELLNKPTQEDSDWIQFLFDEASLTGELDEMFEEIRSERSVNHSLKEPEFDDLYKVMEMGAKKHGAHNWLEPNGNKSSHKDMHASMFRHLSESSTGSLRDEESGLHPLLHLITRALMEYTRQVRGIVHEEDHDE